jgi:hypothetical protein
MYRSQETEARRQDRAPTCEATFIGRMKLRTTPTIAPSVQSACSQRDTVCQPEKQQDVQFDTWPEIILTIYPCSTTDLAPRAPTAMLMAEAGSPLRRCLTHLTGFRTDLIILAGRTRARTQHSRDGPKLSVCPLWRGRAVKQKQGYSVSDSPRGASGRPLPRRLIDDLRAALVSPLTAGSWTSIEDDFRKVDLAWRGDLQPGSGKPKYVTRVLEELADEEVVSLAGRVLERLPSRRSFNLEDALSGSMRRASRGSRR